MCAKSDGGDQGYLHSMPPVVLRQVRSLPFCMGLTESPAADLIIKPPFASSHLTESEYQYSSVSHSAEMISPLNRSLAAGHRSDRRAQRLSEIVALAAHYVNIDHLTQVGVPEHAREGRTQYGRVGPVSRYHER